MFCRDIAIGWIRRLGSVTGTTKLLLGPVVVPHAFECHIESTTGDNYMLKVNNTVVRDTTPANTDPEYQSGYYYNGLLYPGERLSIVAIGTISYRIKYIGKTYA